MSELPHLVLLRPWWLLAVPLVVVLGLLVARRSRALAGWERAVDPMLMAALSRLGLVRPGRTRRLALPILAAAAIAVALAGPARRAADPPTFRNLDGLVVAIDLSRSIAEGGSLPQAEEAAQLMLQRAGTRPTELIVYTGEAYVASAFTEDPLALGAILPHLAGDTVPNPGSRPDRALMLARRTLGEAKILDADVVLITDGGGLAPAAFDEASALRGTGHHVSTVLVEPKARPGDMPAPDADGLRRLAAAGDGAFATAADPFDVAEAVGSRPAKNLTTGDATVLAYTDYGRRLLVLALLPALALFRRSI